MSRSLIAMLIPVRRAVHQDTRAIASRVAGLVSPTPQLVTADDEGVTFRWDYGEALPAAPTAAEVQQHVHSSTSTAG